MQPIDAPSFVFLLLCSGLCYTGFCRLVHVSRDSTDPFISTAIWLMTVCAAYGVFSVAVWGFSVDWPAAVLALGMLALQVATSRAWRQGIPPAYMRITHEKADPG